MHTKSFSEYLDSDGGDHDIIAKAAKAPLEFAQQILPRIADFVAAHSKQTRDRLETDPVWFWRSFGDDEFSVHDGILKSLARALESLAKTAPTELDRLLDRYVARPHETMAYLVLRAWAAAPATYGERLARYLVEDPRRLKVGYTSWSGDPGAGMAEDYRSIEAVRAATSICSAEALSDLEKVIVALKDEWESRHPPTRGLRQLQLLSAMDQNRLGPQGRAKLAELRAKFPDVTHNPPKPMKAALVGSPIRAEAQQKMSDDNWLSAMAKYAGVASRHKPIIEESGGEHELAHSLEAQTKSDPKRFVALAMTMPTTFPAGYFDAIIRGVAATISSDGPEPTAVSLADVVALIERAHSLSGRPCGRWIAHLVGDWSKAEWPISVIEILAWYAVNDPDPEKEIWQQSTSDGHVYYGGDPAHHGLNTTRGGAAYATAKLIFEKREKTPDILIDVVNRLAHDPSIAVRSQAIQALLALLNFRPDLAISWFVECVSLDPILLGIRAVEDFIRYAGYRDYSAIRPVVQNMIASADEKTVDAGARLTCLLALDLEGAKEDAARVRSGSATMRKAASKIYATNVAHKEVGTMCRDLLLPFLADSDDAVRTQAATAFRRISDIETAEQAKLLAAFLAAKPSAAALTPVIRALEDSPVQLPDLVCRLIELSIEQFMQDAGDIRTSGAAVAFDLSKIVIRLYTQSEDAEIKKRCLDAIDAMERSGFLGLSEELGRLDR